jgi:hypothetical protein
MDPLSTTAMASGTVIQTISELAKKSAQFSSRVKPGSLVEFTQSARVEPLCILGSDVVNLEFMPLVMQSLQSIFTGYYLQAIALTTQVNSVKVIKVLDKLNPNRTADLSSMLSNAFESFKEANKKVLPNWRLATESYKWRLPTTKNVPALESEMLALEADSNTQKVISELANLSVGKMVDVQISGEDGGKMSIPISIRLIANRMPEPTLVHLMSLGSNDSSFKERYHAWRAGRLSFVKDLILCQDIITAHKKALMTDKDGVYSEIINRVNKNKIVSMQSGDVSLASASNLFVISQNTAEAIEQKLYGKLSNPKVREKIFNTTYAMIIVVVDPYTEKVTFYHRGIAAASTMSVGDLKVANKGSGPDVSEIMKAFMAGSSPSL